MDEANAAACDIAVVGAGAAGLMAAISAARRARSGEAAGARGVRIIALDGARKLGAKILVAGGGRCNVTHFEVDEGAYAGAPRRAIGRVLRRFDAGATVRFFAELGVELKREETGKLFPASDDAATVLEALLGECGRLGVVLAHPWRVEAIEAVGGGGFEIRRQDGGEGGSGLAASVVRAGRVILATGGMALPKTGSDGQGYALARGLGHSTTGRIFPALVPLTLAEGSFVRALSGLTIRAGIEVRSGSGKRLASFTNSTLCTHFGLSGPSVLDASRYYLDALHGDPGTQLIINWVPGLTLEGMDQLLVARRGVSPARLLGEAPCGLPERLARAICEQAGVRASETTEHLTREARRGLAKAAAEMVLPVSGHRGFTHAEVTAGGVPLEELDLKTMESRACPGLHLCGEICDVDGRIGGFNFQWAWASGFAAGEAAAALGWIRGSPPPQRATDGIEGSRGEEHQH